MKGPNFLKKKFNLHTEPEVEQAVTRKKKRTGERVKGDVETKIQTYLDRFKEIIEREDEKDKERGIRALKKILYKTHIIQREDIPERYYALQQRIAREEGRGTIEITEEMKEEKAEQIIADQKGSLDSWVDYLASPDALYPDWTKYWALRSILSLSSYDKEKHEFRKRTQGTTAPFPDLNREALATVTDILEKKVRGETVENPVEEGENEFAEETKLITDEQFSKILNSENFAKYYAFAIEHVTKSNEALFEEIRGEWKVYEQGSDPTLLLNDIQGHGTGWCTAGEATAREQLELGDFHVYYSLNPLGEPTIPRAAIRLEEDSIFEVKGVAHKQNYDPFIPPVIEEKLKTFHDGEKFQQQVRDMRYLTTIDNKIHNNEDLTKEDLAFLYQTDRYIVSPGYEPDPRIEEIKQQRDFKEDFSTLFTNTVYHHGDINLPDLRTLPEGFSFPEVGGDLVLTGIKTFPEGFSFPEVGGDLVLTGITTLSEGVSFSEVGGDLYLRHLRTLPEGVSFSKVGGNLSLLSITTLPKGVSFSEVSGDLNLPNLTTLPEGFSFPEVGGNLNLLNLTTLPKGASFSEVGGDLDLSNLTTLPESGLALPNVENTIFLSSTIKNNPLLTIPEGVAEKIRWQSTSRQDRRRRRRRL